MASGDPCRGPGHGQAGYGSVVSKARRLYRALCSSRRATERSRCHARDGEPELAAADTGSGERAPVVSLGNSGLTDSAPAIVDCLSGLHMVDEAHAVACHSGRVKSFKWYGAVDEPLYLHILRPTSCQAQYALVGQVYVHSTRPDRENSVPCDIAVQAGDRLGWMFVGGAAFGFDSTSNPVRWGRGSHPFDVGQTLDYEGFDGRSYHVSAQVEAMAPARCPTPTRQVRSPERPAKQAREAAVVAGDGKKEERPAKKLREMSSGRSGGASVPAQEAVIGSTPAPAAESPKGEAAPPPKVSELSKGQRILRRGKPADVVKIDYAVPDSLVVRMVGAEASSELGTDVNNISLTTDDSARYLCKGVRCCIVHFLSRPELDGKRGVAEEVRLETRQAVVRIDQPNSCRLLVSLKHVSVMLTPSSPAEL